MELEELFKVWDRFERSKIQEIEYESGDKKIRLKKPETVRGEYVSAESAKPDAAVMPAGDIAAAETGTTLPDNETAVKAPFVGTFFRASAPGAEPFVTIGQTVKEGDVVGIIEAMKLMNEITAPVGGTVTSIYVEDETLVGFDEPLIGISC